MALLATALAAAGGALADPAQDVVDAANDVVGTQQELIGGFAGELQDAADAVTAGSGDDADQLLAAVGPITSAVQTDALLAQAEALAADPGAGAGDLTDRAAELQGDAAGCFAAYGELTAEFVSEQAGLDTSPLWASAVAQCMAAQGFAADPVQGSQDLLATFYLPGLPPL
ncbi:MAG TPA: hypothetical protein VGR28_05025 [Candidatus Thermoplasmatota archaeon]|jgi:hypothetical protein|nr:hypothetical protein [Candidatus Thermoplasmatota archaeon]